MGKYYHTGRGRITKSKKRVQGKKKGNDTLGEKENKRDDKTRLYFEEMNQKFKRLMIVQIVMIILIVIILAFSFIDFSTEGPVIDAGDGIDLDLQSVGDNYVTYNVELKLKNTGDKVAKVSITGEAYISEMGSAYGDEATTVLKYKYLEIEPGETKDLNLGQLTAFADWHYFVKVHVSWNGGSLELGKILIPGS